MTDHLAKAKDYIAIAESSDSKLAAYKKAADEIIKAKKADFALTYAEIDGRLGRGKDYAGRLVRWRTKTACTESPFAEEQGRVAERHAKAVLKDPERLDEVLPELPTKALQQLADYADEVVAERRQAKDAEHSTARTVGSIMGGKREAEELRDEFSPGNLWADNLIIRLHNNALSLRGWIERKGGLLVGALGIEQAYEYLLEAEEIIADVRADAQEQVGDKVGA